MRQKRGPVSFQMLSHRLAKKGIPQICRLLVRQVALWSQTGPQLRFRGANTGQASTLKTPSTWGARCCTSFSQQLKK